ncbi:type II toxin-antitoxin system RelE/ParE family toxin [Candidatus Peregrinibacteria bacterium]|nr:type II toxin-antitoxin system RelE/ParE family toxin [Candidatus Peregrinibacteria bacterium]
MASNQKYRLELSLKAEKQLSKMDKSVQLFLLEKLEQLEKSPTPLQNAAKLVNSKNLYRHRFGDYRVIFTLEKDGKIGILLVLKIAHRREVYRP